MSETNPQSHTEDESIENIVDTLTELEETGTIDDLAQVAQTISLASEAIDDDMIKSTTRATVRAGELFDTAAGEPAALRNLEVLTAALSETGSDPTDPPDGAGIVTLLRKLNDPSVQRGLGFALTLLGELGDQLEARADRYPDAETTADLGMESTD
ncbi:DUF1641 domain-containing protein [Halapricum desulfuricans]|uniref:YjgD n=1 Tax=Halapricum desulfuricans TaxID=2841257 RepID=A0A897NIA8_9EURY|nr:DUF1641 domain-containing protein [Halapricum desulfuricans]QSG09740.1 YjgD [Halapricum desulfuricans]QSG11165.1 YjgD [Halapricum desulfuricans]